MITYDPTDDILSFRDFQPPWVRVAHPPRILQQPGHALHGNELRPIAYNAIDGLVLLFAVDPDYPLLVCHASSPDGEYGEVFGGYENISHFSHFMRGSNSSLGGRRGSIGRWWPV